MAIQAPSHFVHAGDLDPRPASEDPRRPDFREREVDIDLRIHPAPCGALVRRLGLLDAKRNSSCRLLVPENLGVAIYLKSMELFRILQDSGVEVDDRGVGSGAATRLIIPIAQFTTETEVDTIASQASERLSAAGVGAANLYSVVAEVFAELAMNAVQHSLSEIGCLGLIQFYQSESGVRAVQKGGVKSAGDEHPAIGQQGCCGNLARRVHRGGEPAEANELLVVS
jgi:hypothetical protein